jgi:hypothetical protein
MVGSSLSPKLAHSFPDNSVLQNLQTVIKVFIITDLKYDSCCKCKKKYFDITYMHRMKYLWSIEHTALDQDFST